MSIWEIEYAEKEGKRVVGVWARGEAQCDVPDALEKYADAVVGWQGTNVIDAITGEKDGWTGQMATRVRTTRYRGMTAVDPEGRLFSYVVVRDYGFAPIRFLAIAL